MFSTHITTRRSRCLSSDLAIYQNNEFLQDDFLSVHNPKIYWGTQALLYEGLEISSQACYAHATFLQFFNRNLFSIFFPQCLDNNDIFITILPLIQ